MAPQCKLTLILRNQSNNDWKRLNAVIDYSVVRWRIALRALLQLVETYGQCNIYRKETGNWVFYWWHFPEPWINTFTCLYNVYVCYYNALIWFAASISSIKEILWRTDKKMDIVLRLVVSEVIGLQKLIYFFVF